MTSGTGDSPPQLPSLELAARPLVRVGRLQRGYAVAEVDRFLRRTTAQLRAAAQGEGSPPDATRIRETGFRLVLHGYETEAVDALLDRLEEDAIALEAGPGPVPSSGDVRGPGAPSPSGPDLLDETRLTEVLGRPAGARFSTAGRLRRGYDPAEVDDFCDALAGALDVAGRLPDADDIRHAVFHERLRGYDEDEVDAFLDSVVDVVLRGSSHLDPS